MDTSVYVHIPFCRARCSYCDFNTYAGMSFLIPEYISALRKEIQQLGTAAEEDRGRKLQTGTVYFGGGTPSLLPATQILRMLDVMKEVFEVREGAEISLEVNPESADRKNLEAMAAGVNRISLGVQTFDPLELEVLGRIHTVEDTMAAVRAIRQAGYRNLSFDLIYGIPGQSIQSWKETLQKAVELEPEHLSLYSLTVEEGTALEQEIESGALCRPDPDGMADMYEQAESLLKEAGYEQYEISNWALPGEGGTFPQYASRHNLQYWLNREYLGVGAGASGFAAGFRTVNIAHPTAYIRSFQEPYNDVYPFSGATAERERINRQREIEDTMMMGLRLTAAGVNIQDFIKRFDYPPQVIYREEISLLVSQGLLEGTSSSIRLTEGGRLLGNQVFRDFIS